MFNNNIKTILNKYPFLYIIDIGFHNGAFIDKFIKEIKNKIYVIGVDPIFYPNRLAQPDKFYQLAIDNTNAPYEFKKFNLYDECGCNSLLNMKLDKLVRDRRENGWFCNKNIKKIGEIKVNCISMEYLIEKYLNLNTKDIIHYLKVDTQGNDLNVIKSLKKYTNKIVLIQIESCNSDNKTNTMYDNQELRENDIEYFKSINFSLIQETDYSHESCPESDLIFINNNYHD